MALDFPHLDLSADEVTGGAGDQEPADFAGPAWRDHGAVVVVDSVPVTALGKPDKKAVRAQFWEGAGRSVG